MIGTSRTGPIGTGLFLLGANPRTPEIQEAELWLSLLFMPLAPLARWRLKIGVSDGPQGAPEGLEIQALEKLRLQPLATIRRFCIGIALAGLICLPLAIALSKVGTPWAAAVLSPLLGALLPPSLLDKVATAAEAGLLVAGALMPILVVSELDARAIRVPFAALRRGAVFPPQEG